MAKKPNIEEIDENFIINSFRQDDLTIPPSARATEIASESEDAEPLQREEPRRRKTKNKETDYRSLFLKEAAIPARIGKTVYIRKEYHDRIQKMLHVIGGNEVTIAAFLDNVLTHHFTLFQDEIAESFKRHMESYNL